MKKQEEKDTKKQATECVKDSESLESLEAVEEDEEEDNHLSSFINSSNNFV